MRAQAGDVANADFWNSHWQEGAASIKPWDYLSQVVLQAVNGAIGDPRGKDIAEGGSGSGRISLYFARAGANVTLIDYGREALILSRGLFATEASAGQFVQADIFKMPFTDGSFDVVWNAGVFEHYPYSEQGEVLYSLLRICRDNGLVVTLNPFRGSIPYVAGKWVLNAIGRWPFGRELPIRSIRDVAPDPQMEVVDEYSIGFIVTIVEAYKFLPASDFWGRVFSPLTRLFVRAGPRLCRLDRWLSKLFGGYLLVSVVRKRSSTAKV